MKTYTGGCHCGAVRYEAETDLAAVMTCNCSHCMMKGFLLSFVPAAQFKLISGEDSLTEYRFNKMKIAHLFCKVCGVQSFGRGKNSKDEETIMLNVNCLDGVDTDALNIKKVDGKSF